MRQEGCDSPLSAWDSETDQGERIAVCDALRTCWEDLLLNHGNKAQSIETWEELRATWGNRFRSDSELLDHLKQPEVREYFDRFFQEEISYSLPLKFVGEPARLLAIGYPLETAQLVLVIDQFHHFQYNDIVSEAKTAFAIGPKGSAVAIAGSHERMDLESGINDAYGGDMTVKNVKNLLNSFLDGTFTIDVEPDTEPQWEKVEPKPGAVRRLLNSVRQVHQQIFASRAA